MSLLTRLLMRPPSIRGAKAWPYETYANASGIGSFSSAAPRGCRRVTIFEAFGTLDLIIEVEAHLYYDEILQEQ
jgi:hypothetical protein